MAEQPRKKKVIVHKKMNAEREKKGMSKKDLDVIKKWIITGSFSNNFDSDKNKLDLSKLFLIRRAANYEPYELRHLVLSYSKIAVNKDTLLLSMVFLSMGSFQAKKEFRHCFTQLIEDLNDIYRFLFLMRRYRGIGSVIHTEIKTWIKHHDIVALERMFIEQRAKHTWTSKDLLRIIKPKPRDKKESLLFRWVVKDEISDSDLIDYEQYLPLVCFYEKIRYNKLTEEEISSKLYKYIGKGKFTSLMIPGNVYRTEGLLEKLLEFKYNHELVRYAKNHLTEPIVANALRQALLDLMVVHNTLQVSALELMSLYDLAVELRINNPIDFLSVLDSYIYTKLQITRDMRGDDLHIIDMSEKMYSVKNPVTRTTPAVIASVMTRQNDNVYSFSGNKIDRKSIQATFEAEGIIEEKSRINLNKLNLIMNSKDVKKIFIWTNTKYLNELDVDLEYFGKRCCLINMGDGILSKKDNSYYTINGFNFSTKKLIKLFENTL